MERKSSLALVPLSLERLRRHRLRRRATLVALILFGLLLGAAALHPRPGAFPLAPNDCLQPARPGINWNHCALDGRLLAGEDLSRARMNTASLHAADLMAARLTDADLSYSNLSRAALGGADLRGARLLGAALRGADLAGARLDGSDLRYADLRGARLLGTGLDGARLDRAIWVDGTLCAPGSRSGCFPATPPPAAGAPEGQGS